MSSRLVERNTNGSISVSEIIKGHLVTKTYYGYTKKEAIEEFIADTKQEKRK